MYDHPPLCEGFRFSRLMSQTAMLWKDREVLFLVEPIIPPNRAQIAYIVKIFNPTAFSNDTFK